MNEIEKLIHAKDYIDRLSNGINPVSDEVLTKEALINDIDLSRCFFFVSDILRQVIENDGFVGRRVRSNTILPPFSLPDELRSKIEVTEKPVMIKHFTESINSLVDITAMRKLKVTALTAWLVQNGFLCEEIINEKKRKKPTKEGEMLGIHSETREGHYGSYLAILYDKSAQQHIVENLDKIIELSNGE